MLRRKRFGQHFLEPVWTEKVLRAIDPSPSDSFLEIGPGAGALTLRLAPAVAHVTAVEIDRDLIASLSPRLPPNVTLISGDFLDSTFSPPPTTASGPTRTRGLRVAGNLPYNISSPILFRLLDVQSKWRLVDATLMVQKEVADRIVAAPGSADYGVLSVLVQWKASVSRLLVLPPGAFRPPPKVTSALIRLVFRDPQVAVANPGLFELLVRTMFTQRRKTVANAIRAFADDRHLVAGEALERAGIDPSRRPQTLQLIEIARLADVFDGAGK